MLDQSVFTKISGASDSLISKSSSSPAERHLQHSAGYLNRLPSLCLNRPTDDERTITYSAVFTDKHVRWKAPVYVAATPRMVVACEKN